MATNLSAAGSYAADRRVSRRGAILCAAHDLFVEKGYEATTLNDIVRRSGGSLATLYALFENKTGLLQALVSERCTGMDAALAKAVAADATPEQALRTIADEMLSMLFDPNFLGLFRIVLSQSAHQPELGQQLYKAGPAVAQAKLAAYLMQLNQRGDLLIPDPLVAAKLFYQLVAGEMKSQLTFGLPIQMSHKQREEHCDFAVSAFMRIFQVLN